MQKKWYSDYCLCPYGVSQDGRRRRRTDRQRAASLPYLTNNSVPAHAVLQMLVPRTCSLAPRRPSARPSSPGAGHLAILRADSDTSRSATSFARHSTSASPTLHCSQRAGRCLCGGWARPPLSMLRAVRRRNMTFRRNWKTGAPNRWAPWCRRGVWVAYLGLQGAKSGAPQHGAVHAVHGRLY